MKLFFKDNDIQYKKITIKTISDSFYGLWYYFFYMILIYNSLTHFVIMPFFEKLIVRNLLGTNFTLLVALGYIIRFSIYYMVLYLEFAIYIIITEKIYNNKKISLITISKSVFSRFKNIISFSNWRLFIVFLFVFPYLNIPLTSSILNAFNISDTVMHFIKGHLILRILGVITLIFLILLSIKWSYALHFSVIDKVDYKNGIKKSEKILRKTFLPLVIIFLFLICSGLLITQSKKFFVDDIIMMNIMNENDTVVFLKIIFIIFSMLLSIIIIPLYFTFLTHIYYAKKDIDLYTQKMPNRPREKRKRRIVFTFVRNTVIIVILLFAHLLSLFFFVNIRPEKNKIMVHRAGGCRVTENTAEAIEFAVSNKFSAIEIDIMETKDGQFVLTHDKNIKRLTGVDKNIYELTYAELKNTPIKLNGIFSFIALEEALKAAGDDLMVNIELKVHGKESPDYLDRLSQLIFDSKKVKSCMISSFDYDALKYIETNYPEIKTILISFYVPMPEKLVTDGFAVDFAYLTENKAERIKSSDKLFIIWTINNDSFKILDAMAFNCDYIITDNPSILRYIKDTISSFTESEDI